MDGVWIGGGWGGITTIVALPGPNDEVRKGLSIVAEGLEKGWGKAKLAEVLVHAYRERLAERGPIAGVEHRRRHP